MLYSAACNTYTLVVPKFILPNFGNFLRRHLASRVKSKDLYLKQYILGEVAPGRVRVGDAN